MMISRTYINSETRKCSLWPGSLLKQMISWAKGRRKEERKNCQLFFALFGLHFLLLLRRLVCRSISPQRTTLCSEEAFTPRRESMMTIPLILLSIHGTVGPFSCVLHIHFTFIFGLKTLYVKGEKRESFPRESMRPIRLASFWAEQRSLVCWPDLCRTLWERKQRSALSGTHAWAGDQCSSVSLL